MKTNEEWKKIVSDLINLTLDKQAFKWRKSGYLESDAEFSTAIAILTKQFNSKTVQNAIAVLKSE